MRSLRSPTCDECVAGCIPASLAAVFTRSKTASGSVDAAGPRVTRWATYGDLARRDERRRAGTARIIRLARGPKTSGASSRRARPRQAGRSGFELTAALVYRLDHRSLRSCARATSRLITREGSRAGDRRRNAALRQPVRLAALEEFVTASQAHATIWWLRLAAYPQLSDEDFGRRSRRRLDARYSIRCGRSRVNWTALVVATWQGRPVLSCYGMSRRRSKAGRPKHGARRCELRMAGPRNVVGS